MRIVRIKVDGYKNIFNANLELSDIIALVSLNNYGKTNILECLDFTQDFIKFPNRIRDRMMANESRMPINTLTEDKNFLFEIEYLTSLGKKQYFVNYKFSFEWAKDRKKGSTIKHEILKIKQNVSRAKYSTFAKRSYSAGYYKSSPQGRVSTKLNLESNELIIDRLDLFEDLYYNALIKELKNINFDLNEFYDTSSSFHKLPIELKDGNIYELEKHAGDNVSKIVYYLKEEYPDKYDILINSFVSLVPSVELIEPVCFKVQGKQEVEFDREAPFKIVNKVYGLRVKERYNNQTADFEILSNGTKRIFIILTSAIIAEMNKVSLIAFEELENCIHPFLFQKLLIILRELISNCRIVVTSHSPYLVQYLDLNNIYIGVPNPHNVATFAKIKKSSHKRIYRDSVEENISIGDYIFDLLVETYDDSSRLFSLLECESWLQEKDSPINARKERTT